MSDCSRIPRKDLRVFKNTLLYVHFLFAHFILLVELMMCYAVAGPKNEPIWIILTFFSLPKKSNKKSLDYGFVCSFFAGPKNEPKKTFPIERYFYSDE